MYTAVSVAWRDVFMIRIFDKVRNVWNQLENLIWTPTNKIDTSDVSTIIESDIIVACSADCRSESPSRATLYKIRNVVCEEYPEERFTLHVRCTLWVLPWAWSFHVSFPAILDNTLFCHRPLKTYIWRITTRQMESVTLVSCLLVMRSMVIYHKNEASLTL